MRTGVTPVLLGACLTSAAIKRCSCFTASPSAITGHSAGGRAGSTSTLSSRSRPNSAPLSATTRRSLSSASSPSPRAPAPAGTSSGAQKKLSINPNAPSRRGQRRARRKTRLSSAGRSTSTATYEEQALTTSQQLRAEVSARKRSRAWELVGFPPSPAGGYDSQGSGLLPEDYYRVEEPADQILRERSQDKLHDPQELQRLLDMSHPPSELLEAADTRRLGDVVTITTTSSSEPHQQQQQGVRQQGDGDEAEGDDEGGVSLWTSRALLAGSAMLYGTNFGCVKLLEDSVPMSLAAALRFSVALVPFIPVLRKVKPSVLRAGAEIGVLNAIGYWAQSESLMTTTASKSAFICSLAVVFVPVLDKLLGAKDGPEVAREKALGKAKMKKRDGALFATMKGPWFPALLAATGVACLELIGAEGGPNSGDVWAMVQPFCFGLGFWLTERCSRKYPDEIFGLVAAQLLTVAVLAIGWCTLAGDLPTSLASLQETVLPSSGSLSVPISLVWTGLVTTALTVFSESIAMKKVSAAESTVILSTEPIWGTAFAAVLLGESVGWNTGLGAMLIVSACTWSTVGPALLSKVLALLAAATELGIDVDVDVDVDGLADAVGTVLTEIKDSGGLHE